MVIKKTKLVKIIQNVTQTKEKQNKIQCNANIKAKIFLI